MKHKLLSVEEMKQTDQAAIASGIDGITLMENAGASVVKHIRKYFPKGHAVILCGPGNNGGDGFVIARLLKEMGWIVQLCLFGDVEKLSTDTAHMAKLWDGYIDQPDDLNFTGPTIIVDAIFGTGLDRPLGGKIKEVLVALPDVPIIAVDMPSGVNGDTGLVLGYARQAYSTVTFCRKKTGHLLYPARELCGQLIVADIGIVESHIQTISPEVLENGLTLFQDASTLKQQTDTHKFKRGYAVIAGAEVMTGATRLAARASQRAGAGYVVIASPEKASTLYRVSLSSVVVKGYRDTNGYKEILEDERTNSFLIGPGMGYAFGAQERVLQTLSLNKPTVLDADALSLFEGSSDLLFKSIQNNCILTPHEGEFSKLFPDIARQNIGKLNKARKAAEKSGAIVVLKGPDTIIASPRGRAVINSNAPSYLATAGSGDVLAGIITGYLAQGIDPFEAASLSVSLHGELANHCGVGLIAEDLVDAIPNVLKKLNLV